MQKTGLYIHIPFCKSKCAYCDFVSFANQGNLVPQYIDAVIEEAARLAAQDAYIAETVFIGGGTPAFLPLGEMKRLVDGVCEYIPLQAGAEFTVEVNPNSISREKAREYAALSVNRISIGLQTASPRLLHAIGRTHSLFDYYDCVETVYAAGITNLNTDIMYALPGQTIQDVAETLSVIQTPHISAYALKIEKGTPMYANGTQPVEEDLDREMYHTIVNSLKSKGYERYEISNFAKPSYACQHNLKYWKLEPYIGLGLSAHSFINGQRYANTADLSKYIQTKGNEVLFLEPGGDALEYIMLKLRLAEGLSLENFKNVYGAAMTEMLAESAKPLKKEGLIDLIDEKILLTDRGFDLQDFIVLKLSEFI